MRDKILLRQLQALPLDAKVLMTQQRIREWYQHFNGDVFISFSGGKDSTVLSYLVHDMYPEVPLVFANTGLEYPEIQMFARQMGAEFIRPRMSFSEVISKYGYPIIGKEVAEAIHFARRIVPIGGVQEQQFKRIELQNRQANGEGRNWKDCGTTNYYQPPLHGRTGWRRANLTGQTPLPNTIQNGNARNKAKPQITYTGGGTQLSGSRRVSKRLQRGRTQESRHQRKPVGLRRIERFRKQLMGK